MNPSFEPCNEGPMRWMTFSIAGLMFACASDDAATPRDDASSEADGSAFEVDAGAPPDAEVAYVDAAAHAPAALPFYEVPVRDEALAAHAFFPVPDVHYFATAGEVVLTYDFPESLSGVFDQTVELRGPIDAAGNATVSGPQGTGECRVEGPNVRCIERFTGLPLDVARARSLASSYGASEAERAARLAVLEAFSTDPIGIVVFDRAAANEPP